MKSAWQIALEKLEESGIERPQQGALSDETKAEMAEIRRRAEASVAELEILHRDALRKLADPAERREAEEGYRRERRRIEERRDRDLERLRAARDG